MPLKNFDNQLDEIMKKMRNNTLEIKSLKERRSEREKVKNENEPRILCNTSIGTIHLSEKKFDETKVKK